MVFSKKDRFIFCGFLRESDLPVPSYSRAGSLMGSVEISYNELVSKLGKPNCECDGYKTDAEWEVITPFGHGTIYNYKDGQNYKGKDGLSLEDITDWHIGGSNSETAECIIKELKSNNVGYFEVK